MFEYCLKILNQLYQTLTNAPFWNNILKVILASWFFFAGIHTYIYSILGLVLIDIITGIIASIKSGEKFKSRLLRRGLIEKVILYNLLMVSVFILEIVIKTGINYDAFYLVLVATVLIATYELSSIMENLLVINPNLKFLKRLIKLTQKIEDKTIKVAEDKIDTITQAKEKTAQ